MHNQSSPTPRQQDILHRRPYEALLLAVPADADAAWLEDLPLPPDGFVLAAIPGQHSRKPALGRLLAPYVPAAGCRLEVCTSIRM